MDEEIRYTLRQLDSKLDRLLDFENCTNPSVSETEETMPLNTCRIRRHIKLGENYIWVCANTEQEYADKLIRLAGFTCLKPNVKKHNFKSYATRWFEEFSKPNVESVTAVTYERQLNNYIFPIIGDMDVEDVTVADVQKIFNSMGHETKQQTKNKVRIVLNQVFKMALDESIILRNPMDSQTLRIKGAASEETKPYSVSQMRYLAAHLKDISNPTDRAWLALSISLPLRPEEVLGLKWENVDEANLTIDICGTVSHPTRNEPVYKPYTKTASSRRTLKFPSYLLLYLPPRGNPEDFVVGGEPISYTQLRSIRRRIEVNIHFDEPITPRRFRTTVATDISNLTKDLKLVQQTLGHSTPQMTLKHYVKGRSTTVDASSAIAQCYGLVDENVD